MTSTQHYIVALDQGTTSSRSILYDAMGAELRISSRPLEVSFPKDGWVEQDAEQIWQTQLATLKEVTQGIDVERIAALGITNQRETIICWDKESGRPLAPAIVWQCRRSADICEALRGRGLDEMIQRKTGLVVDAYFSATKIRWLLESDSKIKAQAQAESAVFGTVDSWLIYNLTKESSQSKNGAGKLYTEPTNASRTMLYNIDSAQWDDELLELFSLTSSNLPEVINSDAEFGSTKVLGSEISITGVLGDQQASLFGHGCTELGAAKCTFGTGAFLLVNTGTQRARSSQGLIDTVAWQFSNTRASKTVSAREYAAEGSVFIAGALMEWVTNYLGLLNDASESEKIAGMVKSTEGVVIVPAFVGMGAPHWDEHARGAMFGLTRNTNASHLVRAALEGVAHQVADLVEALPSGQVNVLRIDGGMSKNKLFCQILSDITRLPIEPAARAETTAFGAALAAAQGAGVRFPTQSQDKTSSQAAARYVPGLSPARIDAERARWRAAVTRSMDWANIAELF